MGVLTGYTKRVEIPHEPGQWVEIRQLSKRQKEKAADVKTDIALGKAKAMGPELMATIQNAQPSAIVREPTVDAYDWATVLTFGIAAWSYAESVTVENIEALDETTADWAFKTILAFSGPPSEDERKNDSPPSIDS